jgi:hypothetical protein
VIKRERESEKEGGRERVIKRERERERCRKNIYFIAFSNGSFTN